MAKYIILVLLLLLPGCMYGDPGTIGDEMGRKRTLENKEIIDPSALTPIVPVIPSNGSWTGNNQLGIELPFKPDSTNRQTVLKLDEWGPPEVWTISLDLRDDLQQFTALQITAIIEFGAGGSTQTLRMDWENGAQISLPMNAVNVIAQFQAVSAFTDEGPGLHLGVQLSRGRRGGSIPPRLTIAGGNSLTAGTTKTFVIPDFAKNIVAINADNGSASSLYDKLTLLKANTGFPAGGTIAAVLDGSQILAGDKLPVIGGARNVSIFNGTVNFISFSLYAELDG